MKQCNDVFPIYKLSISPMPDAVELHAFRSMDTASCFDERASMQMKQFTINPTPCLHVALG